MAVSAIVLATITSLHLIAFVLAVGAERRRSTARVMPDEYDEKTYCVYGTDASTVYGLSAFGLLLISQAVVNGVTRCFCCGKGLISGKTTTIAIFFFVFSWISFVGAEIGLLAGSARNAYHTKYRAAFGVEELSCATLRKGVFAGAAAMTVLSMVGSILYYWMHSKADTGGWEKHENEGVGMAAAGVHDPKQNARFEKV